MTSDEARWRVARALAVSGVAVYEGRARPSRLPDLVVMDAATGATARVRVMVGKRPRRARRLSFDRRRVGVHADALALVDPASGSVDLRPLAFGAPLPTSGVGVASPAGGCFRPVAGVGA